MGRKEGSGEEGDQRASKGVVAGGREEEETWFAQPHLVVLVGGDGDEGGLGEDVGAEGGVLGAEAVVLVRLHDVQPGLVLVHGVEDDLGMGRRRGHLMGMEGGHDAAQPPARRQGEEKRGTSRHSQKSFFPPQKLLLFSPPLSMDITCAGGISPQKSSPPTAKRAHQGLSFLAPFIPPKQHPSVATGQVGSLPDAPRAALGCAAVFPPPETLIHVSTASGGLFLPPQPPPQQHRHLSPPPQ